MNHKINFDSAVLPAGKQNKDEECSSSKITENDGEKEISNEENSGNNQNGRWNKEEHLLFLKGCLLYENNWKKVQKYVKTRSSSQIRSHAQKYLIKLSKKHKVLSDKELNSPNMIFKQMSIEELDNLFYNIHETSPEMHMIEDYILSIFQPDLKQQEILNDSNLIQRRGRKTEAKKKQKIFNLAKCMKIRNQREIQKKNELLCYLNSNDPSHLSKLISMSENTNIKDLIEYSSLYPNTDLNNSNINTNINNGNINNSIINDTNISNRNINNVITNNVTLGNDNINNGSISNCNISNASIYQKTGTEDQYLFNMLINDQSILNQPTFGNNFQKTTIDDITNTNYHNQSNGVPMAFYNNFQQPTQMNDLFNPMMFMNNGIMGSYNQLGFYYDHN